jgi:KaiC/GvpD/RAD55 family RecA-like ATPase
MNFSDLKSKSFVSMLLRGKSGRGKTYTCCRLTLELLRQGHSVKYIDTEAAGSNTLVTLVESSDTPFEEEDVERLDYVQVNSYDEFMAEVGIEENSSVNEDVMVVDTLDHKHTYALKKVTDARLTAGADWNQYPHIYSQEKDWLEAITGSDFHLIATLDPESGSMDKPKGAQTNIHGYFDVVIDLEKSGDEWGNTVRNWIGKGDWIGKSNPRLEATLIEEIQSRE